MRYLVQSLVLRCYFLVYNFTNRTGISCSFASQGSIIGPIIFFLTYLTIWILRIVWTHLGYRLGTKSIDIITENSDVLANAATILGITVIGALIASYVSVNLLPVIKVDGGIEVAVQTEFFDRIFPNLLPMGITLLCFFLIEEKQVSPILLNFRYYRYLYSLCLGWINVK